jgi:hypothetical protein
MAITASVPRTQLLNTGIAITGSDSISAIGKCGGTIATHLLPCNPNRISSVTGHLSLVISHLRTTGSGSLSQILHQRMRTRLMSQPSRDTEKKQPGQMTKDLGQMTNPAILR